MVVKESSSLSERFEEVKYAMKLNNSDLAKIAGVTPQAISDICSGATANPRINLIASISEKLGISVDWLATGKGEMMLESSQISVSTDSGDATMLDFLIGQIAEKDRVINKLLDRLGKRRGVSKQPGLTPLFA